MNYPQAMTNAVLTAIGPDRPGLVEELSQFVFERGGNIETSRMVNLGGYFAIIVMIAGPEAAMRIMGEQLPALAQTTGLQTELLPARQREEMQGGIYRLIARGRDRAGMLHQLSHLLRTLGINIDSVDTRVTPFSAIRPDEAHYEAGRFEMELVLAVPAHVPTPKLREYLGHLWGEGSVSWELVAASPESDGPSL